MHGLNLGSRPIVIPFFLKRVDPPDYAANLLYARVLVAESELMIRHDLKTSADLVWMTLSRIFERTGSRLTGWYEVSCSESLPDFGTVITSAVFHMTGVYLFGCLIFLIAFQRL